VVARLFPGPDSRAVVEALFAKGKPVIYETDDLLIDLPADNPHAHEYAANVPFIEAVARRAAAWWCRRRAWRPGWRVSTPTSTFLAPTW
jgi:hypothetical protein